MPIKVTNQMVLKVMCEYIDEHCVSNGCISQQNPSVIPVHGLYALEHDVRDTTFRSMYGLSALTCHERRLVSLSAPASV